MEYRERNKRMYLSNNFHTIDVGIDDTGTGSIHQKFDGESTFDFTGKNPNATSLDSTFVSTTKFSTTCSGVCLISLFSINLLPF